MRKVSIFMLFVLFAGLIGLMNTNVLFSSTEEGRSESYELVEGKEAVGDKLDEFILKVDGMTCHKCEDTIKAAVIKCKGVKDAKIDHKEGKSEIGCKYCKEIPKSWLGLS